MSADKPLVDDPAWRQHFEAAHDFAAKQWEREDEFYGPRQLPKRTETNTERSSFSFDDLENEVTLSDLAKLNGVTVSSLRHRVERGDAKNGRLPKPMRRRRGQPYKWKRQAVIAFYTEGE